MKSILIVDDDEIVLEEICSHLPSYRTYKAASGREALEMARLTKPDLILLDVIMPRMDGFAILDQLQNHPQLKHIPVIFLTADDSPDLQVKGLRSGAVDFILKSAERPLDWELLHYRIEMHLNLGEYRISLEHSVFEMEANIGLSFAELIECKDYNFSGHVMRTERYAELLSLMLFDEKLFSAELNLSFIENLSRAVPFHDIGKIGISDEILSKAGRLTEEELKTARSHTIIGANILNSIHERIPDRLYFKMASIIARNHHERFDGKGYPDGLSKEDIPLCCRIVAVVNVYDACVSERVYHMPMTHWDACMEIEKGRDTEFDPWITDVFLQHSSKFARLAEEMKSQTKYLGKMPVPVLSLKKSLEIFR